MFRNYSCDFVNNYVDKGGFPSILKLANVNILPVFLKNI